MTNLPRCACCKGTLEPAQQLRFLVETDTLDNPAYLARIRVLPSLNGKPLPVCQACQAQLEARFAARQPQPKPLTVKLLAPLGALSLGLLVSMLLTSRG